MRSFPRSSSAYTRDRNTGPPEKIPALLRARYEGVLDRVSLYYPIPKDDPDEAWKSFVEGFHQASA